MGSEDVFEMSKQMVFLLIVIPIIFFALIIVVALFSRYADEQFSIRDSQQRFLMQRLLYSGDCFAFEDEMVRPGIIDLRKFTSGRMEECIHAEDRLLGMKASLQYGGQEKIAVVNELMTNREFLCKGEGICSRQKFYVLVRDSDSEQRGYLDVEVIQLEK